MRLAHVCGKVSMIDATEEGRCVLRIFLHFLSLGCAVGCLAGPKCRELSLLERYVQV